MDSRYTYRISWSEDDGEFVGTCAEFPSLSHLDKTDERALLGIKTLVSSVVADMVDAGKTPPAPIATKKYSGQFVVRIPPSLHRELAIEASEQNISLNRLVSAKLSRRR
ncbi:MAG: type II toxin-antitoxin system HicB family antitoxin [Deltaproteobacteria bacterium]|nr:type II toxin-antitoxin system HicB family antitoxin [Deltaproteobacteria bacterium]